MYFSLCREYIFVANSYLLLQIKKKLQSPPSDTCDKDVRLQSQKRFVSI